MKPLTPADVARVSRMAANMTDVQHRALLAYRDAGQTFRLRGFSDDTVNTLILRGLLNPCKDNQLALSASAEILLRFLAGEQPE